MVARTLLNVEAQPRKGLVRNRTIHGRSFSRADPIRDSPAEPSGTKPSRPESSVQVQQQTLAWAVVGTTRMAVYIVMLPEGNYIAAITNFKIENRETNWNK